MKRITMEYYGMTGSGATVTEAKRDAGRKIEEALTGDYTPVFVQWRGTIAVMARDPKTGWGYRSVHNATEKPVQHLWLNSAYEDRDTCLRWMLMHIADVEHQEGETEADALFDAAPLNQRITAELKRDFARKAEQNNTAITRRRLAESLGITENLDVHDFIWRNPARRDLWMPHETPESLRALGYSVPVEVRS